jgi:F5/8 type C domain-containing protein
VTVRNPGATSVALQSISTSGDFGRSTTCGSSLAAGASCTVTVTFTPTAAGSRSGTLTVNSTSTTLSGTGFDPNGNLAAGRTVTATSANAGFAAGNAVDGNADSYWESANNAFPQSITVDLGATVSVSRVVLKLPPASAWATRTQTVSVLGSTDGANFSTVVGATGYTFNPATGNTLTISFTATSRRYLRLTVTANTGWPAAQLSEVEVYASGGGTTPPPPVSNLATGRPTSETSHTQNLASGNAVDGNADSYWESTNNAFPQSITVDLGSSVSVSRVVLRLPPAAAWGSRSQTLSVVGSVDGANFTTVVGSTAYTFNAASGNTVSIPFTATSRRYVRVTVTANSGWPAAQLSEMEVYAT